MNCRACGAKEGQLHEIFCTQELCPFCLGQLPGCRCIHTVLRLTPEESKAVDEYIDDFVEPLKSIMQRWEKALSEKGRIPWIEYPVICAKCGQLYPQFFRVPDEEWEKYIQADMQSSVLCKKCYEYIKRSIDKHNQ
jgi:hypothetical protein